MQKKKLNKEIVQSLEKGDKELQLNALESIRKEGFAEYLPVLAEVYINTSKGELKDKISGIFQDLKDTEGTKIIVSLLENTSNADLRDMLLTACWSSSLDFSQYLYVFTDLALQYDYMITFEVLTVVENFENVPPKDQLQEAITRIKTAATGENTSKRELLIALVNALEDFEDA